MKIIHATNHLTRTGGGTPHAVWGLSIEHQKSFGSVRLLGLTDVYDSVDWPTRRPAELAVDVYERSGPFVLGWSPGLHNKLVSMSDADILHQHGIWSMLSHSCHAWKRRWNKPQLVTVHGMLDEKRLLHSYWKKRLFAALIEKSNLEGADCLHALCLPEAYSMRKYGLKNPIAIIPNGVCLDEYASLADPALFSEQFPQAKDRKLLLYMGRLHPLKGLFPMLEAWGKESGFRKEGWMLIIGGPDQNGTEEKLKKLGAELGIEGDVLFPGPLYGRTKSSVLAAASMFILPSKTEGFAISLLEAMACRLPLIITRACNFHEVADNGAGWVGEPTVESLGEMFNESLGLSENQLCEVGERGYDLVCQNYTWEAISSMIARVYSWLIGDDEVPIELMMK